MEGGRKTEVMEETNDDRKEGEGRKEEDGKDGFHKERFKGRRK
jgi:hypothetical protein